MRLLDTIPHPTYRITAYTLEAHYYIEIEAGPMKQCYKLHKEQTAGLEGIKKWLDEEFLGQANSVFETMYKNYKASADRNLGL